MADSRAAATASSPANISRIRALAGDVNVPPAESGTRAAATASAIHAGSTRMAVTASCDDPFFDEKGSWTTERRREDPVTDSRPTRVVSRFLGWPGDGMSENSAAMVIPVRCLQGRTQLTLRGNAQFPPNALSTYGQRLVGVEAPPAAAPGTRTFAAYAGN